MAFNLDGESPPPSIITGAPTKEQFTCTVRGRAAHAALEAEQGKNAICRAAAIILKLPQGRVDRESTANIGLIQGGKQTNVVPGLASFTGEVRSFSPRRFGELKDEITRICREANTGGYEVEISWEHTYDGYQLGEDEDIVRRFKKACLDRGLTPRLLTSPGGGDANNLNAGGIKTVVFGVGMHDIHSPRESLVLDEFYRAAALLEAAVLG
jgi:tripeptide aminopeptidase